jgi:hypothetical protein
MQLIPGDLQRSLGGKEMCDISILNFHFFSFSFYEIRHALKLIIEAGFS